MNVLSLFDGISCGRVALERAGIKVDTYYASEIDKYAIKIAQKNYPNTVQLGDVNDIDFTKFTNKIDLLLGGSPCTDLSIAKKNREGLKGKNSSLFWKYAEALNTIKPKWFIFENVASMKKEDKDIITKTLGVEPIMINSALVSAQQRKRLYWTNIPNIQIPKNKNIKFKDILQSNVDKKYYYSETTLKRLDLSDIIRTGKAGFKYKGRECDKCPPLTARHYKGMQNQYYPVVKEIDGYRNITPIECERLQTLPDNYTEGVSDTQRYKIIGNAWTVDVIAHILKYIKH